MGTFGDGQWCTLTSTDPCPLLPFPGHPCHAGLPLFNLSLSPPVVSAPMVCTSPGSPPWGVCWWSVHIGAALWDSHTFLLLPHPQPWLPLALPTCLYPLLPDHPGLGACHLLRPTPLWPPWVRSCDALTLTVISGCPCSGWALRAPVLSAGPPPLLMLAARLPLALCLPCISRQVWGQTRLPHSGLLFPLPVTSHTDLFLRTSARDIREPALSPCCSRGFPTLLLYLALFPPE